jgi:Flp pilus assembly protein TadD
MPEHEGNEENHINITPEGETANYISLDQVLMLAFQHARNNREIYGRFENTDLVWSLNRAEETEDFYDVRLSYRPTRDFRGRPGLEQFIIPKTGGVEFRQIISEPRPIWWSPLVISSAGAVLVAAVAVGAILGSGVLTPSPTSTTTAEQVAVPLKPNAPARLISSDVMVDIPAASVSADTKLTYRRLSADDIPVLPATFRPSKAFDLSTNQPLLKPITITVDLSAEDTRSAESQEDNILIQHHRDGSWVPLKTNVDFGASTATSRVDHLSIFALTIRESKPADIDLPVPTYTSAPDSKDARTPDAGQVPLSTVPSADTAYRNGVAAYKNEEYQLAIHELSAAIDLEPDVRNYYWYRGLANSGLARLGEAIGDYDVAINLDPDNATLYALRGKAYSDSGRSEQALMDLDKAIDLTPGHAMAHYTRGDAYAKTDQDQRAQEDYADACRLDNQFCK